MYVFIEPRECDVSNFTLALRRRLTRALSPSPPNNSLEKFLFTLFQLSRDSHQGSTRSSWPPGWRRMIGSGPPFTPARSLVAPQPLRPYWLEPARPCSQPPPRWEFF